MEPPKRGRHNTWKTLKQEKHLFPIQAPGEPCYSDFLTPQTEGGGGVTHEHFQMCCRRRLGNRVATEEGMPTRHAECSNLRKPFGTMGHHSVIRQTGGALVRRHHQMIAGWKQTCSGCAEEPIAVVSHRFRFIIHITETDGTFHLATLPSTSSATTLLIDRLYSLQ